MRGGDAVAGRHGCQNPAPDLLRPELGHRGHKELCNGSVCGNLGLRREFGLEPPPSLAHGRLAHVLDVVVPHVGVPVLEEGIGTVDTSVDWQRLLGSGVNPCELPFLSKQTDNPHRIALMRIADLSIRPHRLVTNGELVEDAVL